MALGPKVDLDGKPRTAITNVAMHLFGKQGFTGTSMRDIANAVGLLPGSLYAHIQSKEALLLAIVSDGIACFTAAVEPLMTSQPDPVERLRLMIVAHVEVVADNPERSQVVFHQWRFLGEENLPRAVQGREDYETLYVRTLQEGVAAGRIRPDLNLRIAVLTILGALNWTPEWFSPTGKLSAAQVGAVMADTLLRGIVID
ncbi:TetR/AcrR family transcriptional regulator [Novosphingobium sp. Fuku2-ISO-50]|uniref:TetR/AcrR family transcriptional regulator n=1 Tax=Novosphingobium sp. Fuku2-ISO-50 TaxID=1739114 RepID=UPI00076BD270|nr:TetR/AcrR family transcriptional regulator [Novosphingobium sp. Fuku2-ISO-50]KUR73254.1 TetR family transcriptional regulator [Novosphingobium sp. Fuku2-ISO-50]